MRSRYAIVGVTCLAVLCIFTFTFRGGEVVCDGANEPVHTKPIYLENIRTRSSSGAVFELQDSLKQQRNELSRELNKLRQKLGKMDCEKSAAKETNELGGWCRESSKEDGGQHMTDMPLVKKLSEFFKGKAVGSFGDGPGAYKRELLKIGEVKSYDAYDGAPYCEETSEGRVKFMDLTVPQYGIPIYDWILSLEVAEHIPKAYESVYIGNLVRHCRQGIVMSWAVPEQGGLAHINNRPLEYVVNLLGHYGFAHDKAASKTLQDSSSFQWLRQNINAFTRNSSSYIPTLEKWYT